MASVQEQTEEEAPEPAFYDADFAEQAFASPGIALPRAARRRSTDQEIGAVDDGDATAWAVPYTDLTMLLMVFFIVMLSQAGPSLKGPQDQTKEALSSEEAAPPSEPGVDHGGQGLLSSDGAVLPIDTAQNSGSNGVLPDQNGVLQSGTGVFASDDKGSAAGPQGATRAPKPPDPGRNADLSPPDMERRLEATERQLMHTERYLADIQNQLDVTQRQLAAAETQIAAAPSESSQPEARTESRTDGATDQQQAQDDTFTEEWARRVQALEASAAEFLEENDLLTQIDLVATPLGVELRLPEEVLFSSGSPNLETNGVGLMAQVLPLLESTSGNIQISGHTDDVPIRTSRFPSNWELSAARAIAVVRVLRSMGIPEDRLEAVGHGANRPIASNATAEGRSQNRRVTIDISPTPN